MQAGGDSGSRPTQISKNVWGLRTDSDVAVFLDSTKDKTAIISFGSSWCTHCQSLFPSFLRTANQNPGMEFAVGQVDYMQSAASDITYTPTLAVYRKGRKVDEFYGANPQQIRDRVWLQSD